MAAVRKYVPGFRFGRLVIVERVSSGTSGGARFRCRCDCGRETVVHGSSVSHSLGRPDRKGRHPGTRSCGCLQREVTRARATDITKLAWAAGVNPATARSRTRRGETPEQAVVGPRRAERFESADGVVGTLADHARRLGVSRQAIDFRIASGWPLVDAISLPASPGGGR